MDPLNEVSYNGADVYGQCVALNNIVGATGSIYDSSAKTCSDSDSCAVPNCEQCSENKNNCFRCEQGYQRAFKEDGSIECKPVEVLSNGCLFQNADRKCTVCMDGRLLRDLDNDNCDSNATPPICSSNCLTCGIDSHICLTCYDQYVWNNDFTCTCGPGNYINQQNNQCVSCNDEFCKDCSPTGECNTCYSGYHLYQPTDTDPVSCKPDIECASGTYFHSISQTCEACECSSGQTCQGSSTNCFDIPTTCNRENEIKLSDGSCSCIQGFIFRDNQCVECAANCSVCLSTGLCDLCKDGTQYIFNNNSCPRVDCASNEYVDSDGNCQACNSTCATCFPTGDRCTTCSAEGAILNRATGVCACPDASLFSSSLNKCFTCPSNCTSCTLNNDRIQCSACQEGHIIGPDGTCTKEVLYCDGLCEECNTTDLPIEERKTLCTKCLQPTTSGADPLYVFRRETIPLAEQCQKCNINIDMFTDSTLPEGEVIHFVPSESPNECYPCLEGCATCSSLNQCDTCLDGFVKRSSDGHCVQTARLIGTTCSKGYYFDQEDLTTCYPCHHSCESCTGNKDSQCLTCRAEENGVIEFTHLYKNRCTCPPGNYYDEINKTCKQCHSTCMFCNGPGDAACTRCAAKGSKPFFDGNDSGICYPCSTQREKFPQECPDSAVFKFTIQPQTESSISAAALQEKAQAENPKPEIPTREPKIPRFQDCNSSRTRYHGC